MPTVEELNQRHPSCDREHAEDLAALYEGGRRLELRYHKFLPQREHEKARRYQDRKAEAQYRNYLGPIIDYFTSMLFVSRPVLKAKDAQGNDVPDPGEYWTNLREDCDGGGQDLDALFKTALTQAMVEKAGWARLHQPNDGGPKPESAADFERRKLGECWLEQLDGESVLDWETDDNGRLLFAVTHKSEARRNGPSSKRDQIVETWQWLTPESVDTYRLTHPKDKPPQKTDEVPLISSVPHTFGAVPLVCLDLPTNLWVANRLKSPQLAHFRKLNAQAWSLSCTAYAMPVAKVRDPEEFKKVQGAGYGIAIGIDESWEWEAPPNGHFTALDTEIKAEKDEIFRIAHQMALGVENNAAAVGRSAESKASDAESTRVVLTAFSRAVKETIEVVLDLITRARGEKFTWSVEGLDDFAALDVDAFLEQMSKLKKDVGMIPSKTFAIQTNQRMAESLLRDADEETKATIRKEIEAGTTDPAEDAALERELAAAMFAPPEGARRPGETAPDSKPPAGGDRGRPAQWKVPPSAGAAP
ncbi:MAG TPA: hypothetical protein VGK73_15080 [Polyangiaceae bacterium]